MTGNCSPESQKVKAVGGGCDGFYGRNQASCHTETTGQGRNWDSKGQFRYQHYPSPVPSRQQTQQPPPSSYPGVPAGLAALRLLIRTLRCMGVGAGKPRVQPQGEKQEPGSQSLEPGEKTEGRLKLGVGDTYLSKVTSDRVAFSDLSFLFLQSK